MEIMSLVFCFLYGFFLLFLGYLEFTKTKSIDNYIVANRQGSAFGIGMSIIASCIGGSATIGMVALSYKVGFPAIWWLLSGATGLSFLSFFMARRVRETKASTLPQIIRQFVGTKASFISSIIIVIAWSAILAAQFSASGRILSAVLHIEFFYAVIVSAMLVSMYAFLGGQASVIKSDIYQFLLVAIALLFVFAWLYFDTNVQFSHIKFELVNEQFTYSKLIYYLVILGGSYVVCPMLFARLLSAKDEKSAVKGSVFGVFGIVFFAFIIVFIGLGISQLASPNINPDTLLSEYLFQKTPSWMGILLLFGLFSAIISSADSCLITASSIFCHDIIRTKSLPFYRVTTFLFGVIALMLTFYGKSILGWLLAANDIYVSGVVAPVFVTLLAYKSFTLDERYILLAMLLGGGFGFIAAFSDVKMYSFIGVSVSIILSMCALRKAHNAEEG